MADTGRATLGRQCKRILISGPKFGDWRRFGERRTKDGKGLRAVLAAERVKG